MKINDAASVSTAEFREPYIGMPIYVDQRDHERYYGRRERRSPVGEVLEDLLEAELLEDIIRSHEGAHGEAEEAEEALETSWMTEEEAMGGGSIGEIIQENIEAYCRDSMFESWPIAMAYVPWQSFREVYGPEDAFQAGTIFLELDLPFLGGGVR